MPADHIESNIGTVSNGESAAVTEEAFVEPSQGGSDDNAEQPEASIKSDVINVARGFCMGAADTVPGVSGGTVALILGHYQRLVGAISRVDRTFIAHLLGRRFTAAWDHLDGRFVVALGAGIGAGIVTLAGLMHWLLDHRLSETYAVFFGLILASIWIVKRYVPKWTPSTWVACGLGIAVAIGIGRLSQASESASLPYLFLAGSVAICAMILPGISGAFVLLLFGVYHPITGMIKNTVKGDVAAESLVQMSVFAVGCLFGLLAFSKVLRWLLEHQRGVTMAALIGLMIGSVEKLWPMQRPTPETAALKMKERVMESIPMQQWDSGVVILIGLAVVAATAVLVLDRVAGGEDH
ncbi:MAG: DUF368 domain-containing protein [Planctomycetota bacterium]